MAEYRFRCENCKKEKIIDAPISQYDEIKNNQFCECGEKMNRVLEWQGTCRLVGDGFYGIDGKKGWNE